MSTPVLRGAYVGLLAASNAVVSKHGARRAAAPFTSVSKHLLPPNLRDAVRLLSAGRDESDPQHRLARATAISALQALDKVDTPYDFRPGGHVEKLLTRRERNSLRDRKKQLAASPLTKLCRYCTLFQELVHDSAEVPVEVVNHGARIQGDFDLATSISKAGIVDYQLFLPQELADQALTGAHPLFWEDTAPEIFKETSPAIHLGTKPFRTWDTIRSHDRGAETDAWERRATNNPEEYIYEHAEWPWNEEISTKVENILRITAFADATTPAKDLSQYLGTHRPEEPTSVTERVRAFLRDDKPSLKPLLTGHKGAKVWPQDEVRFLNYDYSLKSCLRSSYGIGWEEGGGLNVDDGGVMGLSLIHI